eukprot:5281096-Amphidinium_carterae.1
MALRKVTAPVKLMLRARKQFEAMPNPPNPKTMKIGFPPNFENSIPAVAISVLGAFVPCFGRFLHESLFEVVPNPEAIIVIKCRVHYKSIIVIECRVHYKSYELCCIRSNAKPIAHDVLEND